MSFKKKLLSLIKKSAFQFFWEKTHRISLIGMNYWGGCSITESGEIEVIKHVYKTILSSKNHMIIFDVGSNVGQYLQQLVIHTPSSLKSNIHCFEPSRKSFELLTFDKIESKQVKVFFNNFGLSDAIETRELYSSSDTATIASLYNLRNTENSTTEEFAEKIKLSTIDEYCEINNIIEIDFLKIDIEGHEINALIGAKKLLLNKKVRFIQFEFGDRNIDSKTYMRDFFDILSANYNIYRVLPFGLRLINRYSEDLEIFATSNFLAELKNK